MPTTLKLKIQELTTDWIVNLKKIYTNAVVEINVIEESSGTPMTTPIFWSLIDLLDWKKGSDTDAIIYPVVQILKDFDVTAIFQFHDILATKLYALDQQVLAENMGSRRFGGTKRFSTDVFLYARAGVVANGRQFFNAVLADPTKMPKEFTFEALLYIASEAYELKTNTAWDYLPIPSYETYSNKKGWHGKDWASTILNF